MRKTVILILLFIALIAYFNAVLEFRQISKIHAIANKVEITADLNDIRQIRKNLNNPNVTEKNIFEFLKRNNISSIIVEEESLKDWNDLGFISLASGAEILDAFRIQGLINLYIWEQIKDKEISPDHTYIFTDNSVVFENLKLILQENFKDRWKIYSSEQKVFDGQITHNYIIEAFIVKNDVRNLKTGLNISVMDIVKLSGLEIYYKIRSKITPRVLRMIENNSDFISGVMITGNFNYNLNVLKNKQIPVILPENKALSVLTTEKVIKLKEVALFDSPDEIFKSVKYNNARILKISNITHSNELIFSEIQNFIIRIKNYFTPRNFEISKARTIRVIRTTNAKVFILFLGVVSLILLLFNFATKYNLSYLYGVLFAAVCVLFFVFLGTNITQFRIFNIILITITVPALSILLFEVPKHRAAKAIDLLKIIAVLFIGINLITIAGGILAKGFLNDINFIYSSAVIKNTVLKIYYAAPILVAYLLYINISQWENFGHLIEKYVKIKHIFGFIIIGAVMYFSNSAVKSFFAGDFQPINFFIITGNILLILALFLISIEKIKFVIPLILCGSLSQTLQLIMFFNVTAHFKTIGTAIIYNFIYSMLAGIIIIIIIFITVSIKNKRAAFGND